MDAKKITEDYHDWHNIAELRLLGLSRSQIAKKLQLPPGRVMRLSRLNVDELLQHGNRPRPSYSCRLDPYEESVKHLLITCPYYSSTQIHEYLKENNPSFPKVCEKTYNPQIQISAESETKRSIFREKDKTKRSKKESAQHSKSRNKSFVMTSVSAL